MSDNNLGAQKCVPLIFLFPKKSNLIMRTKYAVLNRKEVTNIDVIEKLVVILCVLGISSIVCYSSPVISIVAILILIILFMNKKGDKE